MKWLVFVAVAAGILIIFGATYAISRVLEKKRAPKYKTTAPDDDPQFLRDLAKKLKDQDAPAAAKPDQDVSSAEPEASSDPQDGKDSDPSDKRDQ
ncbi:hypothetical protein [Rhodoluna limnophila]|uniref:hypothetical protein n=1 Tax=Rhodoluna limnophila TaxID=232537 RepID=UPI001105FDCF|nr:hypothetical protein [Rhodoluna limnophila]